MSTIDARLNRLYTAAGNRRSIDRSSDATRGRHHRRSTTTTWEVRHKSAVQTVPAQLLSYVTKAGRCPVTSSSGRIRSFTVRPRQRHRILPGVQMTFDVDTSREVADGFVPNLVASLVHQGSVVIRRLFVAYLWRSIFVNFIDESHKFIEVSNLHQ